MNREMDKAEKIWRQIERYEGEIFSYIKHAVGDGQTARDLCQDVYLSALQNAHKLNADRSLKNWFITVARHRVINYMRDRKKYDDHDPEEQAHSIEPPIQPVDEAVRYALARLPERQRQTLLLQLLDNLRYQELAGRLNLSAPAVTSLLKRARDNFTRSYLLYHLPLNFRRSAKDWQLKDLARFINTFEETDRILQRVQERSQNYFGRIRERWDSIRNRFVGRERLEHLLDFLQDQADLPVLDAGAGTGFVSVHAALRGWRVLAMDLNGPMLQHLKSLKRVLNLSHLHVAMGDINHLPLAPGRLSHAVLHLVLHHVPNPQQRLRETAHLIKGGGRLLIVDFMRHRNKALADQMHDLWLGFNPASLEQWAGQGGLQKIHEERWKGDENIEVFSQIYQR